MVQKRGLVFKPLFFDCKQADRTLYFITNTLVPIFIFFREVRFGQNYFNFAVRLNKLKNRRNDSKLV